MQAILLTYPPGSCDFRNEFDVFRGSRVPARDEFEVFRGSRVPARDEFEVSRGSWVPARDEFEVFRGSWVPARDEFEVFRGSKKAFLWRISSMPKLQKHFFRTSNILKHVLEGSRVPRFPPSTNTGLRFLEVEKKKNFFETNLVRAAASKKFFFLNL